MIQHIVLFTPKGTLSESERRSFAHITLTVLGRSKEISRFTVGRRVEIDAGYARSFGDKTYEYAAVLEFSSRESLLAYLNSQEHGELGRLFWQACESSVVAEVEVAADQLTAEAVDTLV